MNMTDSPNHVDLIHDELHLTRPYRLWYKIITAGKPIVVLVHGAVVPLLKPNYLHEPKTINNEKYCFYNLEYLLYHDDKLHYNVFTFEYADWPILDFGSVNYHDLEQYGKCLIEAIRFVKARSKNGGGSVGPIYVIAHSMGGLVARYAVQNPKVEKVDKIITLDTGHHGFKLANIVDDLFLDKLTELVPTPTFCVKNAEEGSAFVKDLNNKFDKCPPLVSLAALKKVDSSSLPKGLPPIEPVLVVEPQSSNMGLEVYPLKNYDHVTISQIKGTNHKAYQIIKEVIGKDSVDKN
ncbi:MAG TPA: hypothetical protein VED16_04855 [Candidatus Acidoferrum sp.]|nr:hypothetical protein [Candidatus Acidoferrum sp.]